jgi:hypothetical protein
MIVERNYLEVYPYEKWSDRVALLLRVEALQQIKFSIGF